ncbi:ferritin-like domain-containing protein [Lentilactobacillus sp. Marseille-Q4993]|uniref:ferritin-like domain-containing protein n=1 Tax=Lentilactobacillus sp. Marseille-Q4993 TaxID=3039492 RepID=UPI0024BC2E25|nr:ferritin-like domain-containing protein [Lentilactobacillus sp. Marseille-Q4993]
MTTATAKELFEEEVKQADIDHHTPTAGAMTSHVVSNLVVLATKLQMAKWYVKGTETVTLKKFYSRLLDQARYQTDTLGATLLDEGEITPSTTKEFTEYTMLTENGQDKYEDEKVVLEGLLADFNTENMFVTRAIKLAQKEDKLVLAQELTNLLAANQHNIQTLSAMLGDWKIATDEDDED